MVSQMIHKKKMFAYVNMQEDLMVCKLPPHTVDVEIHVRSAEGTHFYREDLHKKTVSYLHLWGPNYQPYDNVKRKIQKVLRREADRRIPRVGTLSRNGPGVMRPWTRPSLYQRRLTSSLPRVSSTATRTTSTHHRSSSIRYAPYPRRSSSTSTSTVTSRRPSRPQTLDFVGNFLKNVEKLQIRSSDDDSSSMPSMVSPTPPPSLIVSPASPTSTTPAPPNTPAITGKTSDQVKLGNYSWLLPEASSSRGSS